MSTELNVGIAGLALAAPPILEPILHCVKYIVTVVDRYRKANNLHDESLLQLDTHLYQIQQFSTFLTENYDRLDIDTRSLCKRLLAVLETRLIHFVSILSSLTDAAGNIKKADFAIRGHNSIAQLHKELVAWERSLNNVLFALILANGSRPGSTGMSSMGKNINKGRQTHLDKIADLLRQCLTNPPSTSLRLDPNIVDSTHFSPVPYSGVMFRELPTPSLLEKHVSTASEEDVRDIVAFLQLPDLSIVNLFKCAGFCGHSLLFQIPNTNSTPISLQNVLIDAHSVGPAHDLKTRLSLMKKIASCVLFIHTANHVHKSIRTSNVILLSSALPSFLGDPYLVGFDLSRKSQQASGYTRTSNWWEAYYLPPDRQGDTNRAYTMLDDVYSFGVVLLELSLWRSFARRRKSSKPPHEEKWFRGSEMLDLKTNPQQPQVLGAEALKQRFIGLAKDKVPILMGSTMGELIVSCLSCVENESAFGNRAELEDKDGIVMAIAFIRQVIFRLESLSL